VTHLKEHGVVRGGASEADWREVVENTDSTPIEAFFAVFRCANQNGFKSLDVVSFRDPLFHYGQDHNIPIYGTLEINAADPNKCPGGVTAVIFSDGRAEGDLEDLHKLYAHRRGAFKALGDGITILNKIANGSETSQQAIDYLDELPKSLQQKPDIDGFEKIGMASVYSRLKFLLQYPNSTFTVPRDLTPHRQPSVAEAAQDNNVSPDRARAIVLGRKLQEWRDALAGNLELHNQN
jgi:hypothetical protein